MIGMVPKQIVPRAHRPFTMTPILATHAAVGQWRVRSLSPVGILSDGPRLLASLFRCEKFPWSFKKSSWHQLSGGV